MHHEGETPCQVLALAGGAGLGFTIPVTLMIAALPSVLTFSYRQVIAAFPGGGAYGGARTHLGRRAGLLAGASILLVIVAGLARGEPAVPVQQQQVTNLQAVGVLPSKAFANGCGSLTGVEAIANAVPSFRKPRVRRAQRAEVALGALLAVMLIGIAALIEKFAIVPVDGARRRVRRRTSAMVNVSTSL